MLEKNERNKLLNELATTNYGRALFDYLQEELNDMSDITKTTEENFKAKQEAVIKLREIFRFLNRIGLDIKEKSNIQYL